MPNMYKKTRHITVTNPFLKNPESTHSRYVESIRTTDN